MEHTKKDTESFLVSSWTIKSRTKSSRSSRIHQMKWRTDSKRYWNFLSSHPPSMLANEKSRVLQKFSSFPRRYWTKEMKLPKLRTPSSTKSWPGNGQQLGFIKEISWNFPAKYPEHTHFWSQMIENITSYSEISRSI